MDRWVSWGAWMSRKGAKTLPNVPDVRVPREEAVVIAEVGLTTVKTGTTDSR